MAFSLYHWRQRSFLHPFENLGFMGYNRFQIYFLDGSGYLCCVVGRFTYSLPKNIQIMIWYQYLFLVGAVVLYGLSQLHQFGKLKWQDDLLDSGFFGQNSWHRKYKKHSDSRLIEPYKPAYFGSTTFLVWTTDFYHLAQMLMKWCFAFGLFGITWSALIAWICWSGIQYGCFKLFSKNTVFHVEH